MATTEFLLHLLQSEDQVRLLDDIDKLRTDGVQYHDIKLPQLVVCGDQSSGKSSVLEALSHVRFPVDTSTCTRFAMELALRRSPDSKATAQIIPGKKLSANRRQRLEDFKRSDLGLADVPKLIEEARAAMGLGNEQAICDDVLRLEISGPDLPHLTLVDLPGLIADAKDTNDVKLVEEMATAYMKNKRSIILAIVCASNDKENQRVLRLARDCDPHGDRTVGIITKPDKLKPYRGSIAERTYLNMAKNQDSVSKLRLGWHVVRNPDYHEKQDGSTYNRDEMENEMFSQEPWNELSKWQLGIGSLREGLTKHLFNLICSELPAVVQDIEREEAKCAQELKDLGKLRVTSKDQSKYLMGISRRFEQLVGAALAGHWTSDSIFSVDSMRLRAQIRNLNDAFEKTMIQTGHTFEFTTAGLPIKDRPYLMRKADRILKSGRGQELPGMFDPILVSDIFRDQSQKWANLAREHVGKVWEISNQFLQRLLFKIAPARTSTAAAVFNRIVSGEMVRRKKRLDAKIAELLRPYVQNLPFCTSSRMAASLKQVDQEDKDAERGRSLNQPFTSLHQPSTSLLNDDIDTDACSLLLRSSQAYYNIARDTFVDNVATLAIENCLLSGLADIFSSDIILDMDDGQLADLAGESEKILSDRKYAEEKSHLLKQSLETCRRHMAQRPVLHEDSQRGREQEPFPVLFDADTIPPGRALFASVPSDSGTTEVRRTSRSPLVANRTDQPLRPGSSGGLFDGPTGTSKSPDASLPAPPASVNPPPSSNYSFGSSTTSGFRGFVFPPPSFAPAADALKGSLGVGSSALSPSPTVDGGVQGRRSPSLTPGVASTTTGAATSTPNAKPGASDKPARLLRVPTLSETSYDTTQRVIQTVFGLSNHLAGSYGKILELGSPSFLKCSHDACAQNKSFEELRLEDRVKLGHPAVQAIIQQSNPELSDKTFTSVEIEIWYGRFMEAHGHLVNFQNYLMGRTIPDRG